MKSIDATEATERLRSEGSRARRNRIEPGSRLKSAGWSKLRWPVWPTLPDIGPPVVAGRRCAGQVVADNGVLLGRDRLEGSARPASAAVDGHPGDQA